MARTNIITEINFKKYIYYQPLYACFLFYTIITISNHLMQRWLYKLRIKLHNLIDAKQTLPTAQTTHLHPRRTVSYYLFSAAKKGKKEKQRERERERTFHKSRRNSKNRLFWNSAARIGSRHANRIFLFNDAWYTYVYGTVHSNCCIDASIYVRSYIA